MSGWLRAGLVGVAACAVLVTGCAAEQGATPKGRASGSPSASSSPGGKTWTPSPASTPVPTAWSTPKVDEVRCTGGVRVSDADGLRSALAKATSGDVVRLADGTYRGGFEVRTGGVTVCGGRGAVVEAEDYDDGYAFHVQGADHVRLAGFTVRNGQKGVVVDDSDHVLVERLAVSHVGDEAIHLRAGSSDGLVRGNVVRETGLRKPKFGEGVYIGSAQSNWCEYSGCKPDRSDRNVVEGNDIAGTTAENVDLKEGTTGGVLRGNKLSGDGAVQDRHVDSWVDVKGNAWLVQDNVGSHGVEDGFQVHVVVDGWGQRNVFRGNTGALDAAGYAFWIDKNAAGTVVSCGNRVTGARSGLATVGCARG